MDDCFRIKKPLIENLHDKSRKIITIAKKKMKRYITKLEKKKKITFPTYIKIKDYITKLKKI